MDDHRSQPPQEVTSSETALSYERGLRGAIAARPLFHSRIRARPCPRPSTQPASRPPSTPPPSAATSATSAQASSTMDLARTAAAEDAPHGALILAEAQTAGRGRRGGASSARPAAASTSPSSCAPRRTSTAACPWPSRLPSAAPVRTRASTPASSGRTTSGSGERKLCGMLIDGETGPGRPDRLRRHRHQRERRPHRRSRPARNRHQPLPRARSRGRPRSAARAHLQRA